MTHRIPDQVIIPIVWNDDENTWEVDTDHLPKGPLEQSTNLDDRTCAHDDLHDRQICDEAWGRASASDLPTADDLAHMLGFHMIRTAIGKTGGWEGDADGYVQRPFSPALVDMLDGAIQEELADVGLKDAAVRRLIRRLLPIFGSVDRNAEGRGVAMGRRQVASGGEF